MSAVAAPLAELVTPADLLVVLEVSLAAIHVVRPLYGPAGTTIIDFAPEYINPTGQRLTGLPERPTGTVRTHVPPEVASEIIDYYRRAFEAETTDPFEIVYQNHGLDRHFRFVARRSGERLIVSFTDLAAQDRGAVEQALRQSQAREQAARAEAERQRGELQRIFEQAPVAIAVYRGPHYVIELANPLVCALWGRTQAQAVGTPLFDLLPEIIGQGYEQLLDKVLTTGEPHVAQEMPSTIERRGRLDTVYWNFVYLPVREEDSSVTGVMVVATEVSEQVQARQQVQVLNEELQASNGELLRNSEELLHVQQAMERLHQALEARVQERTQALEVALRNADQQRSALTNQQHLLGQILGQVPAAIATLSGPEHRYSFFNDSYQALSGRRTQLGHTVAEVFPEVVAQGFVGLLDEVYATGKPLSGRDTPAQLYDPATGQPEPRFVDFIYQPLVDGQGKTQGILAFIVDVTDKVLARQQAETLQAQVLAGSQRPS